MGFSKQQKKRKRVSNHKNIDEKILDTKDQDENLAPENKIKEEEPPHLSYSPYLNQLHLYFEKSLLEDTEMEDAHQLTHFLIENPEFYPEDEEKESVKKRKEK